MDSNLHLSNEKLKKRKCTWLSISRWAIIKNGVQKNLTTPIGQKPMEMKEYMQCYTAVHVFCTTQKARKGEFWSRENQGGSMFSIPYLSVVQTHLDWANDLQRFF